MLVPLYRRMPQPNTSLHGSRRTPTHRVKHRQLLDRRCPSVLLLLSWTALLSLPQWLPFLHTLLLLLLLGRRGFLFVLVLFFISCKACVLIWLFMEHVVSSPCLAGVTLDAEAWRMNQSGKLLPSCKMRSRVRRQKRQKSTTKWHFRAWRTKGNYYLWNAFFFLLFAYLTTIRHLLSSRKHTKSWG